MSLIQTLPYSDENNYQRFMPTWFDWSSGNSVKLKNLKPSNATFYASYNTDENGDWGDGVLTGSLVGGASVAGGNLDLEGNTVKYCDYAGLNNADSEQRGCIRFQYIPNYTGNPAATRSLITISKGVGLASDGIFLDHTTTSTFSLKTYNQSSGLEINYVTPSFVMTTGQVYTIELNYDFTAGETRLFIDGILQGVVQTSAYIRGSTINLFRVGSNFGGTYKSDCKIGAMLIFNEVQHTANFTPDWTNIYDSIYSTANPWVLNASSIMTDGLNNLSMSANISGADDIGIILVINGVDYWYDGGAWVISDSTYAKSNDTATILANKATIPLSGGKNLAIKAILYSDDGSTTPELDEIVVTYDFSFNCYDIPNCVVYGCVKSVGEVPVVSNVRAYTPKPFNHSNNLITIDVVVATDSMGRFDMTLIETETIDVNTYKGIYFDFIYIGDDGNETTKTVKGKIIPNQSTVEFEDLLDI